MNYSALQQMVQEYCENEETSFVGRIPNFVRMAEQKLYRTVRLPASWSTDTIVLSIGTPTASLPEDCLVPFSLQIDGSYPLLIKDKSFIQAAYPTAATQGEPKVYARVNDTTVIFGPTPDSAYSVNIDYQSFPTSIVDGGTSWLGDNAETALLYGTLVNAYTHMKGDPDLLTQYRENFNQELAALAIEYGLQETDEAESGGGVV